MTKRLVAGITGATGAIFGVRLLEKARCMNVETHLIMSKWGKRTIEHECPYTVAEVQALATETYSMNMQSAPVSSGSFLTEGMVIAPCSMRTLAAIAHGFGDNLVCRAADVVLKEHRKLVLMVREAPLNEIHLENMLRLARMGAVILAPMPAFYNHPKTIDDIVDHIVARTLDQFDLEPSWAKRWEGKLTRQRTGAEDQDPQSKSSNTEVAWQAPTDDRPGDME